MEIGEVIFEFIGEILIPFFWRTVVVFPGAVMRKIIFQFTKVPKPFDYYFTKSATTSGFVGLACYVLIGFILAWT